jgi:hypothetical protein
MDGRMLSNPHSLNGRFLKAKYFSSSSILEAEASLDISNTWRSILKGFKLLTEGIVWRVGDV